MVASEEKKKETTEKKSEKPVGPKDVKKADELSEEDQRLKDELNLYVQRLKETDRSLHKPALEGLRSSIKAATTSMTSVPKPLKFLREHYDGVKVIYESLEGEPKSLCADIISVLAMTTTTGRDCLKYRLLSPQEPVGAWGHEYVRHLTSEIASEYRELQIMSPELEQLTKDVVEHHMSHNAEAEAVDLLMETDRLESLLDVIDEHTQPRVSLYLLSCVPYVPDPENTELLKIGLRIHEKFGKRIDALRTAIVLNDQELIMRIFVECKDPLERKQMAIILGRQQNFIEVPDDLPDQGDLSELASNSTLSQYFLQLARELDIMEPKTPEDIYKSHLEPTRGLSSSSQVDKFRMNLADAFVNGVVNCGFGVDKFITEDANKWFFKNKDMGLFSAAASQGFIYRWDVDSALTELDKYLYVSEDYIKAGTLLSIGVISSGVQHECDPAAALLLDYVKHEKPINRIGSILGLGLAYANSTRTSVEEQVLPALKEALSDPKATPEVIGVTALALGLIRVGSGDGELAMEMWGVLENAKDQNLPGYRFLALGIGLIYLGRQEQVDIMLESLRALRPPFKNMAVTLVEACAYAATGNVLKIQKLLHVCSQQIKPQPSGDAKEGSSKKDEEMPEGWLEQAVAVLGIGLIASAEDVGSKMSFRMFGHLLRYGEVWVRRAVPLALALIYASNPELTVIETLSKFSHDPDPETTHSAIFAMGIMGAGTNSARLGAMLRQLAAYHHRDTSNLFLVRLAQGLTHMGKGTLTLHPFHSDRQLLCMPALGALLSAAFCFLDSKNTILGKQHYLLYTLVPAIQPRMLITFVHDETANELQPVNVSVRVGQAVDVVGQAGKPKSITGFQTHTTPVLLSYGDRAELATEEYLSVTPVLEGFVILKKNPDYQPTVV